MFEDEPGTRVECKNSKGQKLAGWLHKANDNDQLIILAHGHPSYCHGKHILYAEVFKKNNLNALRFDFSGCGASEGDFQEHTVKTAYEDFEDVIQWAKDNNYTNIQLMGSSFGGAVVIKAASLHQEIKKIVLRSPAPDMTDETEVNIYSSLEEWKEQGYYLQTNYKDPDNPFKISYKFYEDAMNFIVYEDAKNIKAQTLILAGSEDEIIPLDQMKLVNENIPNSMLIILEGGNHTLTIDGSLEESNKLMVDWFIENKE